MIRKMTALTAITGFMLFAGGSAAQADVTGNGPKTNVSVSVGDVLSDIALSLTNHPVFSG
jgi:hypothetical protein